MEGGKTKACRVDDPATGTSRVKVFWDGKAYADDGPYKIVNHERKAAGKPLALTPKHW